MRVLRVIAVLVILLSSTAQAGAVSSPEMCQRMVLSLLYNFDANNSQSKQQLMTFADKCVPESALSRPPESFKTLQLKKNHKKTIATQARI